MHKMFHPAGLFSGFVLVLPRDHELWRQELHSCLQVNCNQRVSKNSDGRSHHRAAWKYQHFDGFDSSSTPGCFAAQGNLTTTIWSVSDTTNINISNVHDATYGVATCKAATTGAATVTATVPDGDGTNVTNTASLTCN